MTGFGQLTHKQARHLAAFINALRGDWDTPGIEDQLGQARAMAPAPDLAIAAIKAASLATNRTPKIIGLDGPHWRGSEVKPRMADVPRHLRCSVCSEHQERCVQLWTGDHVFEASIPGPERDVPKIVEALKGEVQPMRDPKPTPDLKHQPAGRSSEHVQALRDATTTPAPQASAAGTDEAASAAQEEDHG